MRTGKCMARHSGLVFTPNDKGFLGVLWDKTVIHWDVSLLKSTHEDNTHSQEVISKHFSGGLTEVSRFVGHKVGHVSILPAEGIPPNWFPNRLICPLLLCIN